MKLYKTSEANDHKLKHIKKLAHEFIIIMLIEFV